MISIKYSSLFKRGYMYGFMILAFIASAVGTAYSAADVSAAGTRGGYNNCAYRNQLRNFTWTANPASDDWEFFAGNFCLDNGNRRAIFQADGNFVVYNGSTATWSSNTSGRGKFIRMQSDGNLVIYNGSKQALWYTGTATNNGAQRNLIMQSDGNLVLYRLNSQDPSYAIWASNTSGR